jgi:hypothetical protein
VGQIAQGARACARELVGKKGAQVEAMDCLIHCPRARRGALVALAPPAAVATAACKKKGAVMGTRRAPGCCSLEKMKLIEAVAQTTAADAAEQSIHSGLGLGRIVSAGENRSLGCCSTVLAAMGVAAAQDSPRGYRRRTAREQDPAKTDNDGLILEGGRASSCECSQQAAGCSVDLLGVALL